MQAQEAVIWQCSYFTSQPPGAVGQCSLMDFVEVANVGKLFATNVRQGSVCCLCIRPVCLNAKGARAGIWGGALRRHCQVSLQHALTWSLPYHVRSVQTGCVDGHWSRSLGC